MENHLKSFRSDDCVGPLKIDHEEYVTIKFILIRQAYSKIREKCLHFNIQGIESYCPMEFFTKTVEVSINSLENILKYMTDETSVLHKHGSIVSRVLGKLLYKETKKVIYDRKVHRLQLNFIYDYYLLDELIRDDYKIKCLKAFVWRNSSNKNTKENLDHHCVICLEDFLPKENVVPIIPCGHVFHQDCITKWFHEHFRCPICKTYPSIS